MREKNRESMKHLVYRRPYEDEWGVLHDPTTEWDALLKNYKSWIMLASVGEGTRRMAMPASVEAVDSIKKTRQCLDNTASRTCGLESRYLECIHRGKHWRRRRKARQRVVK